MQLVFICSEYEGLVKTGGLADATRGLAKALQAQGHQVQVILPRYAALLHLPLQPQWQSIYVNVGTERFGTAVRHMVDDGIAIALIEHHEFFARPRLYDDGEWPYADNSLRFGVFCMAALAYVAQYLPQTNIIHGHDWQAALAGHYLQTAFQRAGYLRDCRFVFTIHNAAYQQPLSLQDKQTLGLDTTLPSLLALGIAAADGLNTVSQGYRDELLSEPAGCGLAWMYQQKQHAFRGIVNGCDYTRWDPAHDSVLSANFDIGHMQGKASCKAHMLRHFGLAQPGTALPLMVNISRLTSQKGYRFMIPALRQWLGQGLAHVVVMGTGELSYVQQLRQLEQDFPQYFRFEEGFDDATAHQLEAAADFYLMPSEFEPCGLNQIYSLRYGAVPIVRATGGLRDTVVAYPDKDATGIHFYAATDTDVQHALQMAIELYQQPALYQQLQQRGMQQRFGWAEAAQGYEQLYAMAQQR